MEISGIGVVFSGGAGKGRFEDALKRGWRPPPEKQDADGPLRRAYRVGAETLSGNELFKKMRRSDRLSKMAVLAASEALGEGPPVESGKTGIILATSFGAHETTFEFLDNIIEYGEAGVSPTVFSNSVHNAAASYVSSVLGINGPTLTVTRFYFAFQEALLLAGAWLKEGRCEHVLVGAADEYGDVFGYVHELKLSPAKDGKIRPFDFRPALHVPGEGAVFLLLGGKGHYCSIDRISIGGDLKETSAADLLIIDADGLLEDESAYAAELSPDVPTAAYSPVFGSMMIGSAFNIAAGALILKNGAVYPNPVSENPRGINVLLPKEGIELIKCVRYNCYGEKAEVVLKRNHK